MSDPNYKRCSICNRVSNIAIASDYDDLYTGRFHTLSTPHGLDEVICAECDDDIEAQERAYDSQDDEYGWLDEFDE